MSDRAVVRSSDERAGGVVHRKGRLIYVPVARLRLVWIDVLRSPAELGAADPCRLNYLRESKHVEGKIDRVNTNIDQRTAASEFCIREPGISPGNAATSNVVNLHVRYVAECTVCLVLLEHSCRWRKSVVKADHSESVGRPFRPGNPLGALERVCQGLLDEHV